MSSTLSRLVWVHRKAFQKSGLCLGMLFLVASCLGIHQVEGQGIISGGPMVLGVGETVPDVRLQPLKDLDGYFPFAVPSTLEKWGERAVEVRHRLRVALGLWPLPTRTPLKAVLHGLQDFEDYTVEKVLFEAMPGFYVTGSLYRPKGFDGKRPGVLSPHGHWNQGRFMDAGPEGASRELRQGAETREDAARSPLQARNVHLARMGCVVFHYDMIGYADSVQITQALAHGFARQRADMNTLENWGLFSPAAEGHLQSVMGLQTWSSIRALDFLESLPDVDPERLACTGASGGGTQTFLLGALDSRLKTVFPAVMVSTAMQGGCTCENASLLRVGTGNVEMAALFAPKPQALSTANDWTREMVSKGFPELRSLYSLYGKPDHVHLHRGEQFDHNYNLHARLAMYQWFHTHLELEGKPLTSERPFQRLTADELTVWGGKYMRPMEGSPSFERKLLRTWHEDNQSVLRASTPVWDWFDSVHRPAWEVVLGKDVFNRSRGNLAFELRTKREQSRQSTHLGSASSSRVPSAASPSPVTWLEMSGLLQDEGRGTALPTVFLYPEDWNGRVVLWLSPEGKAGLFADSPTGQSELRPRPAVVELLGKGTAVVGVDLLHQGEFLQDGQPLTQTPRVRNPREAAGYTFGYNNSVFVERVHDVVTLASYLRGHERRPKSVSILALDGMGPLAAAARVLDEAPFDRVVLGTGGFRFAAIQDLQDPGFVPGAAKYGDVPALIALGAPGATWVVDESAAALELAYRFYGQLDQGVSMTIGEGAATPEGSFEARTESLEIRAARWLQGN